jgi:Skp family chaperone for outer membrane proteins
LQAQQGPPAGVQPQAQGQAAGQQVPAGANASKYNVAVIDISYIFNNHLRFKATKEAMKKEMETIENDLKADRSKIALLEQERNQFGAGTPDYKTRDEEVARQMAEFQLKMGKLRKDLMDREAKVYYQTYLGVLDAVKWYSRQHNIGLVLRFSGDPADPNRRDDVMREINKIIVMQDQIDITGEVLALINRDVPSQPAGAPAAMQPATAGRPAPAGSLIPK